MMAQETLPRHGVHVLAGISEDGKILTLSLNRPKQLNAMTDALENDLKTLLDFFEVTPSLWVCIITGRSDPEQRVKAFCAGQDLKDWLKRSKANPSESQGERMFRNFNGFGSMSRRASRKPIIAAVDGVCLGGGLEMVVNCDLVVATTQSTFGFPEVSRGVTAAQGAIPRLSALCGHALASELLLLGKPVSAQVAQDRFRFVNRVVKTSDDLMPTAMALAKTIISNSPSAVQVTKLALLEASRHEASSSASGLSRSDIDRIEPLGQGVERATMAAVLRQESHDLYRDANFREGLNAFAEKRKPRWKDPPAPPKRKAKL